MVSHQQYDDDKTLINIDQPIEKPHKPEITPVIKPAVTVETEVDNDKTLIANSSDIVELQGHHGDKSRVNGQEKASKKRSPVLFVILALIAA